MTWQLRKTVVLIGMMGAGKTAVGTCVAGLLGVPFIDSDEAIEQAANMTIPEIFARDGEGFFREKEAQVIGRLLEGPPQILSTGGGAFLTPATREMIAARAVSLWLDADLDLLWSRVRHRKTRPLLRTADPRATLARLLADRAPVYALADLRVTSQPGYSVEDTAGAVIAALEARGDILEKVNQHGGS
ncbi:shikimate kinase [Rhodobacteraceae bacterium MBR-64]